jgi:phosphoglycerate kinase
MLENLRFYPGEEANDEQFASQLASLGSAFVNDAFGASHRGHASVALLPRLLPSAAGQLLVEEVEVLSKLLRGRPARPFVAVFGGAKVASKLPLLRQWLSRCDRVLVGGAMASTLLAATGHPVGASPVEGSLVRQLRRLVHHRKLVLPVDVVSLCGDGSCRAVAVGQTGPRDVNNDLGPRTVELFCELLGSARTVVWNGPLGWFERPEFRRATQSVARCLARGHAETIVGGGETVEAIAQLGLLSRFSFVSTGGGAMMEFLEGRRLPGLAALGYYGRSRMSS